MPIELDIELNPKKRNEKIIWMYINMNRNESIEYLVYKMKYSMPDAKYILSLVK